MLEKLIAFYNKLQLHCKPNTTVDMAVERTEKIINTSPKMWKSKDVGNVTRATYVPTVREQRCCSGHLSYCLQTIPQVNSNYHTLVYNMTLNENMR
jgi:hypothetical protein